MALQTPTSPKVWAQDAFTFEASETVPGALILGLTSPRGQIVGDEPVIRVGYVDDAAATFVAEGDVIDESDPTLGEAIVASGKIALLVRVSREQYRQQPTPYALADSVARAIVAKADQAFLNQAAPTPPALGPSPGLLTVPGTVDGGEIADNLDGLIDLVSALEVNGAWPTNVLLAPDAWAALQKFKTGSGSAQTLLGSGVEAANRRLLGLSVSVHGAVPAGTGLIIDRTSVVSAIGPIEIATSSEVYFDSDSMGVRATWRIGHTIVRPDRLGSFTVTAPVVTP